MSTKEELYKRLVEAVQEDYRNRPKPAGADDLSETGPIYVHSCAYQGKRLNLWSYWQGSLDADILVVGQDWGCFRPGAEGYKNSKLDSQMQNNFEAIDNGATDIEYFHGTEGLKRSDTDENLIKYFKSLGSDFTNIEKKNSRLFFTNLCLGYRNRGFTGGFKRKWVNDDLKYFWVRPEMRQTDSVPCLLDVLQPKVVLCMGQEVYNAVRKVFGEKRCAGTAFYDSLDKGDNYFVPKGIGREIRIYGFAHPGNMGTANRYTKSTLYDKKAKIEGKGQELQKQDWEAIREYLLSLEE